MHTGRAGLQPAEPVSKEVPINVVASDNLGLFSLSLLPTETKYITIIWIGGLELPIGQGVSLRWVLK